MAKKMTKAIRSLVYDVNRAMQHGTLRENDKLFYFVSHFLSENNMYHGFNLYCWATLENGDKWLKLAGSDDKHKTSDGKFIEHETDIRQFYVI